MAIETHRPSLADMLVWDQDEYLAIEAAIKDTKPQKLSTDPNMMNREIFNFARRLRAMPRFRDMESTRDLQPVLKMWFKNQSVYTSFASVFGAFSRAWKGMRFAANEGPLAEASKRAAAAEPPIEVTRLGFDDPALDQLGALVRELQIRAGAGQTFFLTNRNAGHALRVNHVEANNLLWVLINHGILDVVELGERGRATRYIYLGDIGPPLEATRPTPAQGATTPTENSLL